MLPVGSLEAEVMAKPFPLQERHTVCYSLWYDAPTMLPAGSLEANSSSGALDCVYSLWYNAPKLLPAAGLERGGTHYLFGMKDVARATSCGLIIGQTL